MHIAEMLEQQPNDTINSFEMIDAMEKAVRPVSIQVRANNHNVGEASTSKTCRSSMTEPKLKKGQVSTLQFFKATVFMMGGEVETSQLALANSFEVVGGVSDAEVKLLQPVRPGDRSFRVQTWMVRMMTARLQAGGLAIPPPLLSRTYQVLSDGTAAAMQARKISHVEFPFALRQLLAVLLAAFSCLAPMCICAFIESTPLAVIISFFVLLGYIALNETARELEQPFGLDANDLALTDYQKAFNHKLAQLLDLTIPELGYCQRTDYSTNHLSTGYDARLSSKRPSVTDMPRMPAPPPGFDATVSRASEIENVEMA